MPIPIRSTDSFVATALFVAALALACESPFARQVDLRPADGSVRSGHEVEVVAGNAIEFLEVDGTEMEATQLVLAPGRYEIRYRVRRNLRTVNEMLQNVYHFGECTLELEALRGFDYRVRYAAQRETGQMQGPRGGIGTLAQNFGTQMLLENTVTGDVTPLVCELAFDCRRLKDGIRRSRYCVL
ncbi:MAG: hypothetical protein NXI30_06495 [bacterium]|nr:hypothetical protein [bacterium]